MPYLQDRYGRKLSKAKRLLTGERGMHMKKVFIFCNYEPLAFLIERIVTLHFSAEIILSDRKMEAFDMYYLFEPGVLPTKRGKHTLSKIRHKESRYFLR